jgi:hypothetical protein
MGWLIFSAIFIFLICLHERDSLGKLIKKRESESLSLKQSPIENIKLSNEQIALFDLLENTNRNIFITGKAGTGKSLLLQYFKEHSHKKIVVCAPTGVAAMNVGGQTIHSLFKIRPGLLGKATSAVDYQTAELLKHIDTVVIDEISMVRADLMDEVDNVLRKSRKVDFPFGGVQTVMFGDLYQLPPIVNDAELHKYFSNNLGGYFFFNAHVWNKTELDIYELRKVFRQTDSGFINLLNAVRVGDVEQEVLRELNKRANIQIPREGVVILAATNKVIGEINHGRLAELKTKEFQYRALVVGDINESEFPTDQTLRLKKGAQVMLLRNDKQKRWVNGTLGLVQSLSKDEVRVRVDGFTYSIPTTTWGKIRYYYDPETGEVEEKPVSSFTQFPLRLAWAVTIHKSQGQTYKSCAINLGDGAFAYGQTYVALSRCVSIDGLYLMSQIQKSDISVAPQVASFMEGAKSPPLSSAIKN